MWNTFKKWFGKKDKDKQGPAVPKKTNPGVTYIYPKTTVPVTVPQRSREEVRAERDRKGDLLAWVQSCREVDKYFMARNRYA